MVRKDDAMELVQKDTIQLMRRDTMKEEVWRDTIEEVGKDISMEVMRKDMMEKVRAADIVYADIASQMLMISVEVQQPLP